jgi:hypothetical protein
MQSLCDFCLHVISYSHGVIMNNLSIYGSTALFWAVATLLVSLSFKQSVELFG